MNAHCKSYNEKKLYSKKGHLNLGNSLSFMWSHIFKGLKIIGQLAAQMFHDQVWVIPSLFHLQ